MRTNYTILMVTMGMEIGGAETHILELSCELKRRGFHVIVASNGGVYEKDLEKAGIKHYRLPLHTRSLKNMLLSYRGLKKIIKREKPDIVHGHARIPSFLCGLLHKKMHFPFITSAHWVFKVTPLLRAMSDWGQKTVAVSEDIKKYLMDNYAADPDDISITINGIDLNKFSDTVDITDIKNEFNLGENKKRIVYVSRMDADRSLVAFMLTEIAPELIKQIPNLEIVIVGGGDSFDKLKELADKVNEKIGSRVIILTGARTDINRFVSASDIFVGVSRSALEAMAAAKPTIIAGNEGYIGIFDKDKLQVGIDTNFCCRGCNESSKEQLYNDICYLLCSTDEEEFARLGEYCRSTIKELYSVERMANDYIGAYESLLKEKKIYNDVVISGYYGFKNNGDDTLLGAIVGSLREYIPELKICVLSYDPEETSRVYNVDAKNRFNYFEVRKAMKNAKLLISGGGSLIQDTTSAKSLLYYLWVIRLAQKKGIKTMLFANGIGPVNHKLSRKAAAYILKKVDTITLRDPDSCTELENMGIDKNKYTLTADPAFSITPASDDKVYKLLEQFGIKEGQKIVGISVRNWKGHPEGFGETIAKAADYISKEYGATVIFLNMHYPADCNESDKIIEMMREPAVNLNIPLDGEMMLGIVSKMQFVLGERLHTLIYSARAATPFVAIEYDPKIKGFIEYLGQDNCVSLKNFTFDSLKEKIDLCVNTRDDMNGILTEKSCMMHELSKENAKKAVELYDSI